SKIPLYICEVAGHIPDVRVGTLNSQVPVNTRKRCGRMGNLNDNGTVSIATICRVGKLLCITRYGSCIATVIVNTTTQYSEGSYGKVSRRFLVREPCTGFYCQGRGAEI